MKFAVICVVLSLAVAGLTGPVVDDQKGHIDNLVSSKPSTVEESLMKKLNTKCTSRDVSACMMLKLVTYFNRMLKKSSIEFGDVEITQTTTETITNDGNSRSFDAENMTEEAQLTQLITDKVYSFIRTRSLKWKVIDGADLVVSGGTGKDGSLNLGLSLHPSESSQGDARKKKDNGMGAIMAAAMMKIGLLKALAFKALVLLVGKALLVSKLALVLAAVIGLKKLLHTEKHVTYEVVAHPHHEHHDHHEHSYSSGGGHDAYGGGGGGGGWARNFNAHKMAYSAQIPPN